MWSFHIINYHNYSNMSKTTCACIMYLELCLLTFIIKSWIFSCVTNLFLIWLCWKTTNNDKQLISIMKIKWYYNLSYFFNMYSFQTLFHIVYTFLINYLFFPSSFTWMKNLSFSKLNIALCCNTILVLRSINIVIAYPVILFLYNIWMEKTKKTKILSSV